MSTATATDTTTIEALDFTPICEARTVTTLDNIIVSEDPNRACPNPADVIVTIHRFENHTYRQKYLCMDCLARVQDSCYAGCGAPNITQILSIRTH